MDVLGTARVEVTTLDDVLTRHAVGALGCLKLDTQGTELAILKGAEKALRPALGVEVEVEFLSIYERQPLFGDVDEFLRAQGFELYDLNRYYWRRRTHTRMR